MAMVDQLARSKNGRGEFHAIDKCIKAAFENTDQVLACITTAANSFLIFFLNCFSPMLP